jgi:energy-coupling factor transporter ATP-binding protein EcfA2
VRCLDLTIHNYRGVRDCSINLANYSLLVGANGAGKSTIVNAIRVFYEKDGFKYVEATDKPFSIPSGAEWDAWIEISFLLTEEERATLAEKYIRPDSILKLRKFLSTSLKGLDGKSRQGLIYGYLPDGTLADESFYGAKNVQSGKIGDIIFIPATSRVDDHTKLTGPSILRDLLNEVVGGAMKNTSAYSDLEAAVDAFTTTVRSDSGDGVTLTKIETELNGELKDWDVSFSLRFSPPATGDLVKSLVDWRLTGDDHGHELPPEDFGSGFQRHFIFSLIKTAAHFSKSSEQPKKDKEFSPRMKLLLFEEPEAFLHPPQQEELARALRREANTGRWQVLASTHSSHFVSRNAQDLVSIIRLGRIGTDCNTYQITPEQWEDLTDRNKAIAAIANKYPKLRGRLQEADLEPEMDALRFFLWLNPDRAGAFFANRVLLVEGPTEVALLNQLADEGRIDFGSGISVVDTIGKYNTHRFMNLFGRLGVSHAVVVDDDNGRDEHTELNALISDSKNEFTIGVELLPGKLETLLGVPPAGSDHRKPQHVLFCLANGQVSESGLSSFIERVESLLELED